MDTTEVFQDHTYNVYELKFTTPRNWAGGSPGIVPAGAEFHSGVGFAEPDEIIPTETRLLDNGGSNLPLSPRVFGFDTGEVDMNFGNFNLRLRNLASEILNIRQLRWFFVPRLIDIETMVEDAIPLGLNGIPINNQTTFSIPNEVQIEEDYLFTLANLTMTRSVDNFYEPGSSGQLDTDGDEIEYVLNGTALSLFPSTYTYVIASIVDTNTTYWDMDQQAFVTGEHEYNIFYQLAGFVPDFNDNGVDDLLDIRFGTSIDSNENGIPDESEDIRTPIIPGFPMGLVAIITLNTVRYILLNRNKSKKI
jgi:hypothetical protein